MVTFDVEVSTKCVLVETLKSENNRQHLFYLCVPGFCIGEGTTCVLYGLAVLKYRCAKATLARITLYRPRCTEHQIGFPAHGSDASG